MLTTPGINHNYFPSRIVITSFSRVILVSLQLIQRLAILIEY